MITVQELNGMGFEARRNVYAVRKKRVENLFEHIHHTAPEELEKDLHDRLCTASWALTHCVYGIDRNPYILAERPRLHTLAGIASILDHVDAQCDAVDMELAIHS